MLSCVAVINASPTTCQPPSLHQSVLIFERFAAANAIVLIFLHLVYDVWSAPTTHNCSDQYATVILRTWGQPYVVLLINMHEV